LAELPTFTLPKSTVEGVAERVPGVDEFMAP
jgi:hypothetical protein